MQRLLSLLLSATLLTSSAIAADAQEIKVGSVIQLRNQAAGEGGDRYLEVQGNANDLPAFKTDQFANAKFVFANSSKDRDKVAGSWRVLSGEKKEGDPVVYGDRIKLQSLTPGGAYLADVNHVMREEFGAAFEANGRGKMDAFFAFAQPIDPFFATDWFVGSGDISIKTGEKIKVGSSIFLESLGHGRPVSGYRDASIAGIYLLQASFSTAKVPMFKNYKSRDLVFSSLHNQKNPIPQDMRWIVSSSSSASSSPAPAAAAVMATAKAQTYKIGDKHPDGGIVAIVDAAGTSGLIVDEKDSGTYTPPEAIAASKAKGPGWGVPYLKDLRLVYQNLHKQGKGNFKPALYQAVDASSAQYRRGLHFNDGKEETGIAQNNKTLVRFVKSFKPVAAAKPSK